MKYFRPFDMRLPSEGVFLNEELEFSLNDEFKGRIFKLGGEFTGVNPNKNLWTVFRFPGEYFRATWI
jgi:hypothetical protein